MNWDYVKFMDLYDIPSKNGLTKPSKVRGNGFKMINMGELFANDRIYDIPMELVPLTDSEKEKNKIEIGDLLYCTSILGSRRSWKMQYCIGGISSDSF